MDVDKIYDAMTRLTTLLAEIERRSGSACERFEQAAQSLARVVGNAYATHERILSDTKAQVAQQTRQDVQAALDQGQARFDQGVTTSLQRLQSAGHVLQQSQADAARYVQWLTWKTLALIGFTLVFLLMGSLLMLRHQYQQIETANVRVAAAQLRAEVAEALQQVEINSCGRRPCLKLDAKAPRWGPKGEYVVLDTAPSETPMQRKK